MSIRTDIVNLLVNVNANVAQNALNDLRKKATDVRLEMENLKKGTTEYIAKKKELATITEEMAKLKQQIGITSLTQKELTAELNKLKALKGSVVPFTQEFHDLQVQIEAVESRLYDVKNGVQGFASFFSKISDSVKQFGVMAAGYLGFQFITSQFQSILSGAGKLSDSLADLQRVSGMTADEAAHLNKELKGIDTRTSTEGLREIAIIAGKLGVAKEDIFDFTKAVDMLVVSLGDELGNADQITTQLGKILNVFDGKITADSITKLGNAFVGLANTGSATGGFIADFDQRLSGIAKSAGIGLGSLSGLGAGLEELGGRVESSATAIQKLIIKISGDLPSAAKVAGMSVKDFTKLFAEDGTEAILRYSEGLVKNKATFSEIVGSLKDAGEEGARTVETITKLGASADQLRTRIGLGTKLIGESTEITGAFDLKNQTLGATLDKLGKQFNSLVSSGAVSGFLVSAVNGTVNLIKWLKDLPNFIDRNIIAFYAIAASVIVYNAANILVIANIIRKTIVETASAIVTKVSAVATGIATAAQEAYAAILLLATGRITLATAAQRIWNAALALGAGPLSILIAAVGLLAQAIVNIYGETIKYNAALALQQQLNKAVADDIGDIKQKTEQLASAAGNLNLSLQTRQAVLAQLIAQSPDYLKGLTLENITTQAGINIIDDYINSLDRLSKAKNLRKIKDDADLARQKQDLELPALEVNKDNANFFSKIFNLGDAGKYSDALSDNIKTTKTFIAATDEISKRTEKLNGDIAEETRTLSTLKTGTDEYDKANRTLNNSIKERNALMGLPTDAGVGSNKPTAAGPKGPDNSVGAERKRLQDKLDGLAAEYETINKAEIGLRRKNADEQKAVQAQLDALDFKEGKKSSAEKKAESEHERLIKEAAKFQIELDKIRQKAADGDLDEAAREIQIIKEKYAALAAQSVAFLTKGIIDTKTAKAQQLEIEMAHIDDVEALMKKHFAKNMASDYEQKQSDVGVKFEGQKNDAGNDYSHGVITEQEYQKQLTDITANELHARQVLASAYAGTVKKAAEDEVKFSKESADKKIADAIRVHEAQEQLTTDENKAGVELPVVEAKSGSRAELEAKKAQLIAEEKLQEDSIKRQFDAAQLGEAEKSKMMKLAQAKLKKDLKDLDDSYNSGSIQGVIDTATTIVNNFQSLASSIESIENAQVQNDALANEAKKRNMALQVKSKLLSQQQYDVQSAAMDLAQQTRERKAAHDQAKINKDIQVVQATINTASAVTNALGAPPFGPWTIAEAVAVGLLGAAQVVAIEAQPLPALGTGGWITEGDKHSDASGGINAKIERDEAVIAAAAMTDKTVYQVKGTTAQITSALNKAGGGTDWSGGATIYKPKWQTTTPRTINTNMTRIMEQGGITRPIAPAAAQTTNSPDMQPLLDEVKALRADVANWNTQLGATVSIQDVVAKKQQYDFIRSNSSLSQG